MNDELNAPAMRDGAAERAKWVALVDRLARPVLGAAAEGRLRQDMPARGKDVPGCIHRLPLEPIGRTLVGLTPWLAADDGPADEQRCRAELRDHAVAALRHLTDPASPDYAYQDGFQREHIVDAGILAHALLRDDLALWGRLEEATRRALVELMIRARGSKSPFNNWLLFNAATETLLHRVGESCDLMRIDYALRQHEQWYLGDGHYGDGPRFHCDYYNSFVIQPMLLDVIETFGPLGIEPAWRDMVEPVRRRARRYAAVQERLISPEGTLPPVGRSLAYRFGALQLLGQMALRTETPEGLPPGQVRAAMSAVIHRLADAPGTFDTAGWLTIGWAGDQPDVGEPYITTGSCYLCTAGLLPLGLPAHAPFWSDPPEPWTSRRLHAGEDLPPDHAL